MAPNRPPVVGGTSDPRDAYSPEENQRINANLLSLTEAVHAGQWSDRPIGEQLLVDFHRALFDGVRSHAGRRRERGWGSEYLEFGPNRSVRRDDVPRELAEVFAEAQKILRSIEANPLDPNYENAAYWVAVSVHAEIIRVHPFEDGNGRTSRLLMNCILVRLGFPPIAMELCKQEYRELLNAYFAERRGGSLSKVEAMRTLIDAMIRLAIEQL